MTLNKNGLYPVNFYKLEKRSGRHFSTLRAVGFSYASRERNHCEQPFDFPSSRCEVCHTPRDAFNKMESLLNRLPNRSSYVAERTRKRQSRFTSPFYRFKFNLFLLGVLWTAVHPKKLRGLAVVSLSGSVPETNCSKGNFLQDYPNAIRSMLSIWVHPCLFFPFVVFVLCCSLQCFKVLFGHFRHFNYLLVESLWNRCSRTQC